MPQCAHNTCTKAPRWWQSRSGPGATLDEHWYCSQGCVEEVLLERLRGIRAATELVPRLPSVRLGALLRLQRACAPEKIDAALAAQAGSRMKLGEQLRAMGAVEQPALLRALAEQSGVSYL